MAITVDQLRALADARGLHYFLDPARPVLMMGATGMHGSYQMVMQVESQGMFLQFRTLHYMHCPPDHPHLNEVLKVLGALNLKLRLVKFAWDASDGEIVVYADIWVMDNDVTQEQFNRMLHNYLSALDIHSVRIKQTMADGKDPGDEDPQEMLKKMLGAQGALPPPLRKMLEELKGKGKDAPPSKKPPSVDEI